MRTKVSILAVAVVCSLLVGCTQRIADYPLISTKNVDLSQVSSYEKGQRTKGQDLAKIVFFIQTEKPTIKAAVDNAIDNAPGAVALVDAVIYYQVWGTLIYGHEAYIVEGTPIIDPNVKVNTPVVTPPQPVK